MDHNTKKPLFIAKYISFFADKLICSLRYCFYFHGIEWRVSHGDNLTLFVINEYKSDSVQINYMRAITGRQSIEPVPSRIPIFINLAGFQIKLLIYIDGIFLLKNKWCIAKILSC